MLKVSLNPSRNVISAIELIETWNKHRNGSVEQEYCSTPETISEAYNVGFQQRRDIQFKQI